MSDLIKRLERSADVLEQGSVFARGKNVEEWNAAARDMRDAIAEIERLKAALEFYAQADTYHAITFLPDRPCGEFIDDFDLGYGDFTEWDYDRPMPGMRARYALTSTPMDNKDE